jgi:hypothetical protein
VRDDCNVSDSVHRKFVVGRFGGRNMDGFAHGVNES